eukprot:CAMPEP_0174257526 /NCGR_PEP_ID=MMETSP0439-20130205/6644_1 /TAXON_ID=0 /ORGANISM="Stereomyxa ramosa, Strain Chinc5" /LENGTH=133 /DNA_ID=CAMNT_0015340635 /DNA_START=23 /DNA_END=424 /DNA_ORIENTATION=-
MDPPYGDGRVYWDERYSKNREPFDWYQNYQPLKEILTKYIPQSKEPILIVGCGNSRLTEEMVDDGYKPSIVSVDISPVAIEIMRSRCPDLDWRVGDITTFEMEENSYWGVIDKGTLDTLLCGEKKRWRSKVLT